MPFIPVINPLFLEWADEHRGELMDDWDLARAEKPLLKIEPLLQKVIPHAPKTYPQWYP